MNQSKKELIEKLTVIVEYNDKQMAKVDYDQGRATDLHDFEFEGMAIWNPFYDESMRFEEDPIEYYGYNNIKTFVESFRNPSEY